jgi:hypothetical protein
MHLAAHLAALIAVLSTGVIYGTDAFCALVQRPALAGVDDATLTAVMGNDQLTGLADVIARPSPAGGADTARDRGVGVKSSLGLPGARMWSGLPLLVED